MTVIFFALLGAALGGFFYRCRGGFIGLGSTQLARLIWWVLPVATAITVIMLAHGASVLFALLIGAASGIMAYAGLHIPHGEFQGNTGSIFNLVVMSLIGAGRCVLIMLPVAPHVHALWFLPLFGLLSGPAYRHAWRFLDGIDSGFLVPAFNIFGFHTIPGRFATGGSEWGEVLTGAAIGMGIGLLGAL